MKAFISYSLPPSDEYIISKFAGNLEEQGFYPDLGPYKFNAELDHETLFKIKSSHLFFGILMPTKLKSDTSYQRVLREWEYAVNRKIPAILLVEKSIKLNYNNVNIVEFDKNNPDKAIEKVKNTIEVARNPSKTDIVNSTAWLLGGLALITLITSLANSTQKKKAIAA
jgi:hypothetical protein